MGVRKSGSPEVRKSGCPVIVACATALPAHTALLRLSGDDAPALARRVGLPLDGERQVVAGDWPLAGGACPVRAWRFVAPRSFTGEDVVEVALPGSRDLVDLAIAALVAAGARRAGRGGFARRALANGRLSLDRAEAILAVAQAADAAGARAAIARLRGRLAQDLGPLRDRILALRARLEASLDFVEEDGIAAVPLDEIRADLTVVAATLRRWQVGAATVSGDPVVVLVGRANAGKSALYRALGGGEALVSPVAGTTRDPLEARLVIAGREIRLVDTAGWLESAAGLDAAALTAGAAQVGAAALILACSAPDAPLPDPHGLDADRTVVLATKADLGAREPRAVLAVSAETGAGVDQVAALIADRIAGVVPGEDRQQGLIAEALALVAEAAAHAEEVLLAEDLRRLGDVLGDLVGQTTPDDVLEAIFARFCIGK